MPVLHQLQPSFNNGEISPLLYDRVDYKKFISSVKSGKNMFVHPQGGMSNRAGTVMLAQAKQENVRLIPFEFSSTETYVIEFGNYYCRFYTADGQVVSGGQPYEIESPFATEDLFKIRYCQSGDVMYLAYGGKPKVLIREGHTNWHFEDYDFKNGPFQLENTDINKQLSLSYDSSASKFVIGSNFDSFSQNDVGRLLSVEKKFDSTSMQFNVSSSSSPYTSAVFFSTENYEFFSSGTWSGEVKILYSYDKQEWSVERSFVSQNDHNVNFSGSFDGLVWVKIQANITQGTLYFSFSSQAENKNLIFEITDFVSVNRVLCISKNDIVDLDSLFFSAGQGVIGRIFPIMTSNTAPSGNLLYPAQLEQYASSYYYIMNGVEEAKNTMINNAAFPDFSVYGQYYFGYKTDGSDFVISKIRFYGLAVSDRTSGNIAFSEFFSNFKVFYSRDGGPDTETAYSINNYSLENSGSWRSVSFDVILVKPVVADKIYISALVSYVDGGFTSVTIGELTFYGYPYVVNQRVELTDNFSFGLWADSKYYPQDVELYQDRIVWATNNQLDATKISDYENFGVSADVTEDDAISVIVKDKKVDRINSLIAGQKLAVYSDDGNFVHNNDTFTPNSATFLKQGATGGSDVKPVVVRDHIIYAHPMKQAISDYAYNFETDGYAGQDITLLAHHLFNGKVIKTLAYQQEPYSIIWVLQEEGNVLACTYLRQQDVIAWTPMDFGGEVKSIAVCSAGTEENLYVAVKRNNGTFVEKMETRLLSMDPKESFFVDCGRTYRGEPATVISGLDYLEGEEVVALADGNVVKDLTVENGSITLQHAASVVTVGLPYESVLETLTFDANTGDGSNLNRKKRVVAVSIRYNNSRGTRISVNGHREVDMLKRGQEGYNIPISLKSGFYREIVASTHNEATTVKIRQDEPLPLTVVSVIPEIEYEK